MTCVQVLTSPTFEEEEFDNVMSLSHFYSLTCVSDRHLRPSNDVLLSIPLPDTFFGEGLSASLLLCFASSL
jgi:hypothetical protein